jgi:hypothetical protein
MKLEVGRARHKAGLLPPDVWQAADQVQTPAILLGLLFSAQKQDSSVAYEDNSAVCTTYTAIQKY